MTIERLIWLVIATFVLVVGLALGASLYDTEPLPLGLTGEETRPARASRSCAG